MPAIALPTNAGCRVGGHGVRLSKETKKRGTGTNIAENVAVVANSCHNFSVVAINFERVFQTVSRAQNVVTLVPVVGVPRRVPRSNTKWVHP